MIERTLIELRVNGETRTVAAPEHRSLLEILREDMNLTGTKHGCELGECGACTVLVDGKPMLSCLLLPGQVLGREIETIEGMAVDGKLHPLQKAFAEFGPVQCGYCIPGILLTAKQLLERNVSPSTQEIREALAGNLCRCTGYQKIVEAVQMAARDLRLAKSLPLPRSTDVILRSAATKDLAGRRREGSSLRSE